MRAGRRASGLIVVGSELPDAAFECACCGMEFAPGRYSDYEAHVIKCSNQHEAEMRSQSLREINPTLYDPWLSDVRQWMDKNRDAVLEGRKKP